MTWPFTAVHACFVAGSEPATRYKRRYSEVYSTLYATPAGPTHPFGRTSTGLAGRIDNGGRISRIRSSEAFKGGIR